jgi:hypothetical protein
MKNKQDIERLTEQTLNSLNNMQQVDANEYLYSKIVNRMQINELNERTAYNRLMVRLSMALGLFICLNGISFYLLERQQSPKNKITTSASASFAQEYSLQNNSYSY